MPPVRRQPARAASPRGLRTHDENVAAALLDATLTNARARVDRGSARPDLERRAEEAIAGLVEAIRVQVVHDLLGYFENRCPAADVAVTVRPPSRQSSRRAAARKTTAKANGAANGTNGTGGNGHAIVAPAAVPPARAPAADRAPAPGETPEPAAAPAGSTSPRPALGFYKARGETFVVGQTSIWCVESPKLADRKPARRPALPAGARPCGPPPFAYVPRFCWD